MRTGLHRMWQSCARAIWKRPRILRLGSRAARLAMISSITRCGSGYLAHNPSPSSTPSPPIADTADATAGETMASLGWVSNGI